MPPGSTLCIRWNIYECCVCTILYMFLYILFGYCKQALLQSILMGTSAWRPVTVEIAGSQKRPRKSNRPDICMIWEIWTRNWNAIRLISLLKKGYIFALLRSEFAFFLQKLSNWYEMNNCFCIDWSTIQINERYFDDEKSSNSKILQSSISFYLHHRIHHLFRPFEYAQPMENIIAPQKDTARLWPWFLLFILLPDYKFIFL